MKALLNNFFKFTKFLLKKDRKIIFICLALFLAITLAQAYSYSDLYPTVDERNMIAKSMENPAMIAMMGPVYGNENYTIGALMSNQTLLFTMLGVAIMNILLINRNTRADEETGRLEGIRSLPIGRITSIMSTIVISIIVNMIFAICIGIGLYSLRIETINLNGSMLFGSALGATGIIFASITAVCSQIFSTTRGTLGTAFGILGISYLIRAIGDVENTALSMCSPLGWILKSEVYVNNYWRYVFLTILVGIIFFGISLYFYSIRDLGRGIVPVRNSKKTASPFLKNTFSLGIRLLRIMIIVWGIFILILGISYGSLMKEVENFFNSTEIIRAMVDVENSQSYSEQFAAVIMPIATFVTTIPILLIITKLKSEERIHRIEFLIAKPVKRIKILGSFNALAIIVSIIFQLIFAFSFWYSSNNFVKNSISLQDIVVSAVMYLPAIWLMIGISNFLIGCFPKATVMVWCYYAFSVITVIFGNILHLPKWIMNFSQYENIPKTLIEDLNIFSVIVIIAISVAFSILGFWRYGNRDLENI